MKKEKLKKRILEEIKKEEKKWELGYLSRTELLTKIGVSNGEISVALVELENEGLIEKSNSFCGGIRYSLK